MELFWTRVNKLIKDNKKTQKTLSVECGFSARRIESLSANNRSPDVKEAVKIAQALNTTVEYLVTGEVSANIPKDLKEALNKILSLTENQRGPVIAMLNSQVEFWKDK